MTQMVYWLRIPIAAAVMLSACHGSAPQTRRVEFSGLRAADRVDVRAPADRRVAVLTERDKIQVAAEFIEQHQDGWGEVSTGPRAPELMFDFYSDDRHLAGFGISTSYLTTGVLSKTVPPESIAALARRLGLEWPRRN
jgi:hypothetical protein